MFPMNKFQKGQKLVANLSAYAEEIVAVPVQVLSVSSRAFVGQYTVQILDKKILADLAADCCPDCDGEYADAGIRDVAEKDLKKLI